MAGTDVPKEDTECVDINRIVIFATEQFGCHVYRCTDYAARDHHFRLTEAEVSQLAAVILVKLWTGTISIVMQWGGGVLLRYTQRII